MVRCEICGQKWPRDPALEVKCPKCGAKPGCKCTTNRPSEHKLNMAFTPDAKQFHDERDILAMNAIINYKKCPGRKKK
jgi:predicted RNA-binding Zn-ribbon protein involved in translation (DUF1610 family)